MARKLLVVGMLMATNSSEDIMQVLAVMGVVVVAVLLQLYFRPYAQDRFNSLECFSLASTLLVLYLCAFFLLDDLDTTSKQALSLFIVLVYVLTLAGFVYSMVAEVWRHSLRILDTDGDGQVTREEVRAWLSLTLGGPLSRLVAFVAAPRGKRQRDVSGGGGGSPPNVSGGGGGAVSGKVALAPSPPVSPTRVSLPMPSSSPPPPPPPALQWIPPPGQLKRPPPSPPQAPQVPSTSPPPVAAAAGGGEPVYDSRTAVLEMQFSQELIPTVSVTPSAAPVGGGGAAADGADGAGASYDAAGRPNGSFFAEPPPPAAAATALPRRVPSCGLGAASGGVGGGDSHLIDIEAGGLPGSTASAAETAAVLAAPGGGLPEGAARDGARGSGGPSLAAAAAVAESRSGSRRGMGSRGGASGSVGGASGEGGGGGGGSGDGPRSTAALVLQGSRSGSPATGGGDGGGGGGGAAGSPATLR
ncbi:hypothetical protein PLESTM_000661500 [Pleodorina starrii]|nr:hypothetical protein PLESTM_000661500 [Pleodorina starrii]